MRNSVRLLSSLCLAALAASAISCATSKTDVDLTPTGRMRADAHVGKGWNTDSTKIENISSNFRPEDVVHIVVDVPSEQTGVIRARISKDPGGIVTETSRPIVAGQRNYAFWPTSGTPLPPAEYKLEVWVNDDLVDTEKFKVE